MHVNRNETIIDAMKPANATANDEPMTNHDATGPAFNTN